MCALGHHETSCAAIEAVAGRHGAQADLIAARRLSEEETRLLDEFRREEGVQK